MNEGCTVAEWRRQFTFRQSQKFSDAECRSLSKAFLEQVLKVEQTDLLLMNREVISLDHLDQLNDFENQLNQGIPAQYILGHCYFADLKIELAHEVLIPRPETEELVRWMDQAAHQDDVVLHDFCSGSGCIALALKNWNPKWTVYASDFSEESIKQITSNAENLDLSLNVAKLDVLNEEAWTHLAPFDVLVSNPPYIPSKERLTMANHVINHEPSMALFVADDDPLLFYRKLLQIAALKLKLGGWIYFEIHEDFGPEISELLTKFGFVDVEVKQDLQGRNRMVRGRSSRVI